MTEAERIGQAGTNNEHFTPGMINAGGYAVLWCREALPANEDETAIRVCTAMILAAPMTELRALVRSLRGEEL